MGAADRAERARARVDESCARVAAAASRLEDVLDDSGTGVPIRPIDPEDSLAVSMDGAREESLLQTNRSRRALAQGSSVRPRR